MGNGRTGNDYHGPLVVNHKPMNNTTWACDKQLLLSRHTHHVPASLGTTTAGFGALPTVVHVSRVFFALLGAGIAHFSAQFTNLSGKLATTGHKRYGHVAHFGTITVEPDAVNHHHYVLFAQAGFGAGIATNGAILTGFDTILILLGH